MASWAVGVGGGASATDTRLVADLSSTFRGQFHRGRGDGGANMSRIKHIHRGIARSESVILRAVLIDRGGRHHRLGEQSTDDPDVDSLANRGRLVALLRSHRGTVHPAEAQVLAYIDDGRSARLWRASTLLSVPAMEQ